MTMCEAFKKYKYGTVQDIKFICFVEFVFQISNFLSKISKNNILRKGMGGGGEGAT